MALWGPGSWGRGLEADARPPNCPLQLPSPPASRPLGGVPRPIPRPRSNGLPATGGLWGLDGTLAASQDAVCLSFSLYQCGLPSTLHMPVPRPRCPRPAC